MRKSLAVALLLLTGCQNVAGPFAGRPPQRVDDPHVSTDEQKYRARDQIGLPYDFDVKGMPKSGAAVPSSGGFER
jgi:hypothetical protein